MSFRALAGWWSFMETPKWRILPSRLRSSTASCQSPSPSHSSCQTWNCRQSTGSEPGVLGLLSAPPPPRPPPAPPPGPLVLPDVELPHVARGETEVLEALLRALPHVVPREDLVRV